MSKRIVVTSCIAVLAGVMAPAQAADLDEIIYAKELRETKTVEIGSGWYLRGDLGYQANKKYGSAVANATSPFQGLVPFTPSGALAQNNDFASMTASIGAGYHLNDLFRVDFNIAAVGQNAFGQDGTFTGGCAGTRTITTTNYVGGVPVVPSTTTSSTSSVNCNGSISVDNAMYLGMLNGYVDLGTFAGFTPYIGAGVGLAYTKQTARADGRCQGSQTVSGVAGVSQTTNTFVCNNQTSFASPAVDVSRGTPLPNEGLTIWKDSHYEHSDPRRTCVRPIPVFPPVPARSAPVGRPKASLTRPSAVPTVPRSARRSSSEAIELTREFSACPTTTASASCRRRTPAPSRWRCGRCSAPAGRHGGLGSFGAGWVTDVVKQLKLDDVRKIEAPYGALPDLSPSISTAMWSSPGTAPPRACACRTAISSRPTARA
jgi:opacity protein-like surface antigen